MTVFERIAMTDFSSVADDDAEDRMTLLLADFLACSDFPATVDVGQGSSHNVSADAVWRLALQAGAGDLDDVDWESLHHPGAVIWSAIVGVSRNLGIHGEPIREAGRCGYATAATMADLLGPSHRARWHVTATAGAIGAAAAVSLLLGLETADRQRAMSLAAANVGGLSLAARDRRGAAAFNRAAASVLGTTAALAAQAGAAALADPLYDRLGLFEVMDGTGAAEDQRIRRGIPRACPRLFPVTGFLQSAVQAAARARGECAGDLVRLRVELAAGVLPLVSDEDHGPWWSARLGVLRAWSHACPSEAATVCDLDRRFDLVELGSADLPAGCANLMAETTEGQYCVQGVEPPARSTEGLADLLHRKWSRVLGLNPHEPLTRARELLDS
jgi:hypothetical protein